MNAGIDRIVLSNFKIKNFNILNKKENMNENEYSERIDLYNNLFKLNYVVGINAVKNEIFINSTIEFNPNKILDGNNINNSGIDRLIKAKRKIQEVLKENGIELSFKDAKVKEIEINKNIDMKFEDMEDLILAIGRANYKNANGFYSYEKKDIPTKITRNRSLYINKPIKIKRDGYGKVIKIYDKTFQSNIKYNLELIKDLLRVEILYKRDTYRKEVSKIGMDNSLESLIKNFDKLEKIFNNDITNDVITKTENYINKVIKVNLEKEYLSFKEREKTKRETKKKLIEKNIDSSHIKKDSKGVFEYLKINSWIFDKELLIELVKKYDKRRKIRIVEVINEKYKDLNSLCILKEFKKKLF